MPTGRFVRLWRLPLLAAVICVLVPCRLLAQSSAPREHVLAIYYSMRQAPMLVDAESALRRALGDGLGDRHLLRERAVGRADR